MQFKRGRNPFSPTEKTILTLMYESSFLHSTSDVFALSSIRTNFRSVSFRSVSLCPEQFWITFFGPKRGGDGSNVLPRPVD